MINKTYKKSDLMKEVRMTLDQNQVETSIAFKDESGNVIDPDTLELDDIIESKIIEAAKKIMFIAPLRMIDCVENFTTTKTATSSSTSTSATDSTGSDATSTTDTTTDIVTDSSGKATLTAPDDYMRLSLMQMADWEIPVRQAVLDDTDVRMMVASSFAGIKPNVHRPLVVETQVYGVPTLEMYGSASAGVKFLQAQYIAIPSWKDYTESGTTYTGLKFPELLHEALINMASGLTALVFGAPQANILITLAQQDMGITQEPSKTK